MSLEHSTIETTEEVQNLEDQNRENLLNKEKITQECLEEAIKLNVTLDKLKEDIDSYGGPEAFKEHFEAKYVSSGSTWDQDALRAIYTLPNGDEWDTIEERMALANMKSAQEDKKLEETGINNAGITLKEIRDERKGVLWRGSAELAVAPMAAYILYEIAKIDPEHTSVVWNVGGFVSAGATLGGAILGIADFVQSWRLKIQEKVEKLKFKITETQVDNGTN
jgi:hypothetical protein